MKIYLIALFIFFSAVLLNAAEVPLLKDTIELPSVKINPKDGAEMILIPAGEFVMGTSDEELSRLQKTNTGSNRDLYKNESPQHKVDLDGYYIYKTEVTVSQYKKFCEETRRKMPEEPLWKWQDNHPIVNVSWIDAKAYADWAGGVLPTEAQWEKAARGTDGRVYPWGNDWDDKKCSNSAGAVKPGKTTAVGSFTDGKSVYGVLDMSGNTWEWCADLYGEKYYSLTNVRNPVGPETGETRVLRGGSWIIYNPKLLRVACRGERKPGYKNDYIGFRCAQNLTPHK
jgi:sulfatase modifying factor 1